MPSASTTVILEWTFTPITYFEEPLQLPTDRGIIHIGEGKVEARFDATVYDQDPSIRQRLHDQVLSIFRGAQLTNQKPYKLAEQSTVIRLEPDGRRSVSREIRGRVTVIIGHAPDIRITDKDGNVVRDSRRDRIEARRRLAELARRHDADPLAPSLLESFETAMNDPPNELVHLYEIRDALKKKFRTACKARTALGISGRKWDRLGGLADTLPLRQGRHRGRHTGALRDATEAELADARAIARSMIEAYLNYLERPRRVDDGRPCVG